MTEHMRRCGCPEFGHYLNCPMHQPEGVARNAIRTIASDSVTLDRAWERAESACPPGYFVSAVRRRSKISRYSASATLDLDPMGASYSGFGPTAVDALLDLAAKMRERA